MNFELFDELRRLRNEMAHASRSAPADVVERLERLGLQVPADDVPKLIEMIFRGFGQYGEYFVPPQLLGVIGDLLEGRSTDTVLDPWAGAGTLAAAIHEATRARGTIAWTRNEDAAFLGRSLAPQLDWHVGDPLALLEQLTDPLDVVAAVLPFNARSEQPVEIVGKNREVLRLTDLGIALLAATSLRLTGEGVGLFVVPASFFFRPQVLRDLDRLGLGVEAALALPTGAFAPYTRIATYLVVVRKHPVERMFVAQLSADANTNRQIVNNFKNGQSSDLLDLGRFISPVEFVSLDALRFSERLQVAERRFGATAVRLEELALSIRLGRTGEDFEFLQVDNAIYVPLVGTSNVVDSTDDLTLKRQNYAQVVVDPKRSYARFVANFLNSELGRSIREARKSGVTIPKLNSNGLKNLEVLVPELEQQLRILDLSGRLTAQENILLSLQNELADMRREIWTDSAQMADVEARLEKLSERLSADVVSYGEATLEQWAETLPFPLASILRAWRATPSQDHKAKCEHLLHFFEATTEFLSLVFLSAFASQPQLFTEHRQKLVDAWKRQNLSLERASFGTWKVGVEYFSKQTRDLLGGKNTDRTLCEELFAGLPLTLPEALTATELVRVLSATNKARNDWAGHGGIVSQDEAQRRNGSLVTELQKLREVMASCWSDVQLIHATQCQPRGGVFHNEVALLTGSNSEFLKESWPMATWLDVDRLYLTSRESGRALVLLPLMQVGPSPESAKNACYFFNRVDPGGARFVSYHFADQPEITEQSGEAIAAIRFITEIDKTE